MNTSFTDFSERILRISAKYSGVFGQGLPGMGGTSAAATGSANPSTDTTLRLQHEVAKLEELYYDHNCSERTLYSQAKTVEGLIMMEQTLGSLTDGEAEELINKMYLLVDNMEGQA